MLLLRLLCLGLIIVALAHPLLNPAAKLSGDGPIRLVLDNGWAGADNWPQAVAQAQELADRAAREGREIYIMTTAPQPGAAAPETLGPLAGAQAQSILRGLAPMPWPANYVTAAEAAIKQADGRNMDSAWFSYGLQDEDPETLAKALEKAGSVTIFHPPASALPVLLRPGESTAQAISVKIDAPATLAEGGSATVEALAADGRVIDRKDAALTKSTLPVTVSFELPENLRGKIARFAVAGHKGAGSMLLLDDRYQRKTVGIASTGDADKAPLIKASYYLRRALEPYTSVESGTLEELIAKKPAVIVLADVGALPPDELGRLEKWVRGGGLLLRFAGPNMTQGENFLVPVKLRSGGRALDGALTWDKPPKLAPFTAGSPFYGLEVPEDVTVDRQILADPAPGIEKKTWAALQDGTPLITADNLDKGMLVLVHTTATPDWSDLALSGLYVQMLRRIVALSGGSASADMRATGMLQPVSVLDGFGMPGAPGGSVRPLDAAKLANFVPDSEHPPGIYARNGEQAALNIGEHAPAMMPFSIPSGASGASYGKGSETDLLPALLCAAFSLFLFDWLLTLFLQMNFPRRFRRAAPAAIALLLLSLHGAQAETGSKDVDYAGHLYLAYVKTGNGAIDATTRTGLEALAGVLNARTSVEPAGVVGVNPENDDLSFFPLLYWAVADGESDLTGEAVRNLQHYIDHGGTILFDTRDQGGGNSGTLRRLTSGLNVPPLMEMKPDHVLTRSFYLLRTHPGRYEDGTIWVEEQSNNGRDGVSSIIIGGQDWAGEWAEAGSNPQRGDGTRQQELAMRFGVNLMMYALTGNYKADQVHLPHILERLGQ
jgi:hypothetical protein